MPFTLPLPRRLPYLIRAFPWPLVLILGVQVVLSLPQITSREIFGDEALYSYAGHQMLAHWLHGQPVQDFENYFSGSPAVYPPVAAMADSLGGMAGVRTLSLLFIMATTVLLYLITARLFTRSAGYFAALLFASLGATQFLSALATFDTMALFLLAAATYLTLGVAYEPSSLSANIRVFVLSPLLLAVADVAKYATALWNPVVVMLVAVAPVLSGVRQRPAWLHAARYAAVLAVMLVAGLLVGGQKYWQGIMSTTVARTPQQIGIPTPPTIVLHLAWAWVGVVVILAAAGFALILARRHPHRFAMTVVATLLVIGSVLAPLNQARIETSTSLQKHVVFGAWFGCILAGYAVASLVTGPVPARRRGIRIAAFTAVFTTAIVTVPAAYAGQVPAWHQWGVENPAFVADLRSITHPGTARYLIEGHEDVPAYYVGDVSSLQWKEAGPGDYSYGGLSGDAALQAGVAHRVFELIILNNQESTDAVIEAAIRKNGGYQVLTYLPPSTLTSKAGYTVWQLTRGGIS